MLTLVVTASPLVKRGQELAQWTLKRIPRLKPRFRAEAMTAMAAFACVTVLAGWWLLPQLARIYNNQGFGALRAGDLAEARQKFQRAVALQPNDATSLVLYGRGLIYAGRPAEAVTYIKRGMRLSPYFPAFFLILFGILLFIFEVHNPVMSLVVGGAIAVAFLWSGIASFKQEKK